MDECDLFRLKKKREFFSVNFDNFEKHHNREIKMYFVRIIS